MSGWNPSDKSAQINLTNTNHTAGLGTSVNAGARGTVSHTTGKYYLEFSSITIAGSGIIGLADTTYNYASTTGDTANSIGVDQAGNMVSPNGGATSVGANGKTVGMAFDLGAGKFWITYNGTTWYGFGASTSSDPAAGTNGEGIGIAASTAVYPVVRLQNNGDSVTLNTGETAFAYTVPSGFSAWDTTPPPKRTFGTVIS